MARRRSCLVTLLVTLLALAVVLVAADLVARRVATDRVAAELRSEYGLSADPQVEVGGRSFLWQVVRGRYEDVRVTAAELPTDPLVLRDVAVAVPEVRVPLSVLVRRSGSVDLEAGTVTARVDYADLARQVSAGRLPVELTPEGDAVRATTSVGVLGLDLALAVTVRPELSDGAVDLEPVSAEVAGATVPLGRAERLLRAAGWDGWSIPLTGVPPQVQVRELRVADTGVEVTGDVVAGSVDVG